VKTRKIAAVVLALSTAVLCSDKGFNPPPATHAKTYIAHETHDDESVSIAIDPYDTAEKATIFKVKYRELGFLPIRLIISNDGDRPLMLDNLKIEFITEEREKIQPATEDDIFRRIARPEKVANRPKVQLPIPLPRDNKPIKAEVREEVDSAIFVTVPVTPHSSHNGFLFFDVAGITDPEGGAHVAISGIRAGRQELFYFDIPLEKYLRGRGTSAPAPK
jgi:hypothetical protein